MNLGGSQSYDQLVNGLGFQQHEQQHETTVHHEFKHVTTTASTVATSSVFSFSDSLISSTSSYPTDLPTEKVSSGAGEGFLQVSTRAGLNLSEWQLSQLQGLTPSGVQCLVSNWLNLAKNPIEQPYCNATWDEIYCWPPTLAGETVRRACSEVMKDDTEIDAAKLIGDAYRICSSDATWFWGNWTNYNICLTEIENSLRDARDLEGVIFAVRYILFTGSILSLLCLCVALFIFYYFKSVRCDRVLMHVQLMVALALRFLLLIIITEPFIFHRKNHYRNVDWICKVVLALQLYATVASVNWMFVQGHYLHSRLTTNVFDHGIPLKTYVGLGWGLPLLLISIWAAIMEVYHPVPCWKNYGDLDYCWIIVGPMLFVLLLNLIFLANIMRILLTKIQLTSTASETEQFRRAVKATAVLFPLLGINNLLFFYNPGGSLLGYYMITNSVLQSSQGIFVSLLYCFICKDVKDAIRREYGRFSARRSANSMRSQSRRSGGGGTIRDKLLNRSQRGRQMSASYTRSPHNHKLTTSSVKSERTAVAEDASPGLETIKFFQTDLTPPPGGGTENETKTDCHHLVHHNTTINGMPNNHNPTSPTTITATTTGLLSAPTRYDYNNRHNSSHSSSMSESKQDGKGLCLCYCCENVNKCVDGEESGQFTNKLTGNYSLQLNSRDVAAWRGEPVEELAMGALVTGQGIISIRLHSGVRVDLTVDKAVRVINNKSNIILALSGNGASAALIHPSGCVYQYGSRVEITTSDPRGNSKYAKMWYKGVSFTSEHNALVYLVDTAGTRTTTDAFSDMHGDFSMPVFLGDSKFGPNTIQECIQLLQMTQYWVTEEGVENWIINGIRVSQTSDGLVRVGRGSSKYQLRTSPTNGTASLTTPFVHCTASVGSSSHLFVKRGERRMHYDGSSFIVRNAGHSAGFDEKNQLKVY